MRHLISRCQPLSLLLVLALSFTLTGCGLWSADEPDPTVIPGASPPEYAPVGGPGLTGAAFQPGNQDPLSEPLIPAATPERVAVRPETRPTPTPAPWLEQALTPRQYGDKEIHKLPPVHLDILWVETGPMASARVSHQMVVLKNRQVLVTGGFSGDGTGPVLASAEVYDPSEGVFAPTGSMLEARAHHTATLMDNGEVLVTGGIKNHSEESTDLEYLASAELYNPHELAFRSTGSMRAGRIHHTATELNDGRVLIVGGQSVEGNATIETEVYDPAVGSFLRTDSLNSARFGHTATRLKDGRVLVIGGRGEAILKSAEIYDPATKRFSRAGDMNHYRYAHSATLLPDGRVLVVGGYGGSNNRIEDPPALYSAEIYDPETGAFSLLTPNSESPLAGHSATLLRNNQVLLVGTQGCEASVEDGPMTPCGDTYVFDIRSESFLHLSGERGESNGVMNMGRTSPQAVILYNGNVLVAGGSGGPMGPLAAAELFFFQD